MDNEVAGPSAIYNRVENDREPGLRSVYLITYSKADLSTVHTRECFRNFVLEAFHSTNKDNKVLQYAICRERHMSSFAWIGVEEKEVIYLNAFRWSKTIIAWSDYLRLLEGDEVHFPAPKTHYTKDIKLSKESITPVFSTSIKPISRNGDGEMGYGESIMMQYRWKVFSFHHQISVCDMIDIEPCTACFANLILQHSDSDCEVI